MFKFIHAADIHLDSPLLGLDRYEGAPADAIRVATRRAFSNLVQLAVGQRVDFVILAGDIYDGDWLDYNTGQFFGNEVRKLEKVDIPVVWIRGNHDAESRITSQLALPSNAHELRPEQPDWIKFEKLRVALYGKGYAHQAETRNLAADYLPPVPGFFNIGVLHTALNGREGHLRYAPCAVEELIALGYDYWALGHVHQRESVNGAGRVRIEFPGNIQGRHIRETGAKGCLLVTVDAGGRANPEFQPLDVFRWAEIAVEAQAAGSMTHAIEIAAKAIDDARQEADGRPLAVRLRVACAAKVYQQVAERLEQYRFELAAQAGDQVWVEKIRPQLAGETQEPQPAITGDAASELRATLAEFRSDREAIQTLLRTGECGKLRKVLPAEPVELRKILDDANDDDIFDRASVLLSAGPAEEGS